MTVGRSAQLAGVAVMVLVANVAASFLYMLIYSYVIDPGHDAAYYNAHIQVAAPYCSIVVGIPLMFLAGWWVTGWSRQAGARPAWMVWLVYGVIDLGVLIAAGMTARVAVLFVVSFGTKLAAILYGAKRRMALMLALVVLAACRPPATRPVDTPRKAVFIILDGIPADVVERVETPTIDAIAAAGGYTRAWVGGEPGGPTETPTISAPGYMSLLTSTWANKHNVWDNSRQSPNYAYWNIFRIVETVEPSRRTALFSTWIDNRTVLLGDGKPDAGRYRLDHVADGFELDTVQFPHDKASRYILAIDERVSTLAAEHIRAQGPDLTWVYLQHTDDVAHAYGDSEPFFEAVRQADVQLDRIWAAVKHRQALGEDWMIVVTTDHGRDAVTGKGHGGRSERERRTWIVTNHAQLDTRFTQGTPAIVDIAPSILQHLRIAVPAAVVAQMEGVSFLRSAAR